MNFANAMKIAIPEGNVKQISSGSQILWQSRNLPSAYQQVEWVCAASGVKAYIDLGFHFDEGCKIEIEIFYTKQSARAFCFGVAEDSDGKRFMLICEGDTIYIASKNSSGTSLFWSPVCATGYNKMVITTGSTMTVKNETSGESVTRDFKQGMVMSANHHLFAHMYNGSLRYDTGAERKIGRFSYWDKNGVLICDLYPCYRKSDGVIGMYDAARNRFFTNMGGGSFTKGSDV